MFALDAFSPELTIWQQIGGFLIHLIPSYILLAMLIVAWKWEYSGGVTFTITGMAFCVAVFLLNHYRNHFSIPQSLVNALIIAFPFVIVGVLFIVSSKKKKGTPEEKIKSQQV
jgi:prolipoprotein diacylglyceryltransferase